MEWLGERGRDGGIDTVPLPSATGGLSLCGKHAIAPDVHAALDRCGATTVVCLVELREVEGHWPAYAEWARANDGGTAVWFPIHDLNAPTLERTLALLDDLGARLQRGEHLLMHCAAGIGRAGTLAACLLVHLGSSVDDALALVRASRPMAGPEVGPQLDLVHAVAEARRGAA
jgi:protein-tyrosine phosphatase